MGERDVLVGRDARSELLAIQPVDGRVVLEPKVDGQDARRAEGPALRALRGVAFSTEAQGGTLRGFVVYESLFGNTARIAQAVADGMRKHLDVELHSVAEGLWPEGADLLVMGGPTHAFSMSRATTREDAVNQGANTDCSIGLREWLDELPEGNDTLFAAFDTRVEMVRRLPGSAAKAAAKVARKRGYQLLTRAESFYVHDTPGPLLDGEVQRAEVWGAQLAESLVGEVRDWG